MSRLVYDAKDSCYVEKLTDFSINDILPKRRFLFGERNPLGPYSESAEKEEEYYYKVIIAHFKQWKYNDRLKRLDLSTTCISDLYSLRLSWRPFTIPLKVTKVIVERFRNLSLINEMCLPLQVCSENEQLQCLKVLLDKVTCLVCSVDCWSMPSIHTLDNHSKKLEENLMQLQCGQIKIVSHKLKSVNPNYDHAATLLAKVFEWCNENGKKCTCTPDLKGYEQEIGTKEYYLEWFGQNEEKGIINIQSAGTSTVNCSDGAIDGGVGDNGEDDDDDGDKNFITATAAEYTPETIMKGKQPYHYWSLEKCKYKGEGKVVAIIDSGIDETHPAFIENGMDPSSTSKIVLAVNFSDDTGYVKDENGHGTMCAGVACGSTFSIPSKLNNIYIPENFPSGVAPKAKLVICKVKSKKQNLHNATVRALEWIKDNCTGGNPKAGVCVDVVSYSMGRKTYSQKIEHAISELINAGVIIVCSASNFGQQYQQPIAYPARLGHVLCIGSHGAFGKPSEFSPVGQQINFLAPGEDIVGPSPTKGKIITSGTSYSTPAVAGLVCLILECIGNTIGKGLEKEIRKHCKIADQSKIFNHWIMKEILRKMATNAGIHFSDRGYGSLDPEEFFQNPIYFVKNALGMKAN